MNDIAIQAFHASLSENEVADLRNRLAQTRWPDWLPGSDWSYGVDGAYLKKLCDYWQHDFDFDGHVARLNAWPQYVSEIEGERLHFYHVPSRVPTARPLILVHGWPGSVVEFLDLIGPLSDPEAHGGDPADAFHVVVPSLPGYGFSGPTRNHGVNIAKAASMMNAIMRALGYERYFAQGGDWGSLTTSRMAQDFPQNVAALHINMAPGGNANPMLPVEGLSIADQDELDQLRHHLMIDGAYAQIQTTRPQTLAVAMNDSPAGLAGWIIDKFWSWTDHGGNLEDAFDIDHLLDNLSVYWFTGTAGSSFRLYHENNYRTQYTHSRVEIPTGVARFAGEPFRWPRALVEWNYSNIHLWEDLPAGGHFAAFQRKEDFLRVVRAFFRNQSTRGAQTRLTEELPKPTRDRCGSIR